jgi:type IV secretion system protein VirB4
MTVLGGGRTGEERAPHGWRADPDFWKEMIR